MMVIEKLSDAARKVVRDAHADPLGVVLGCGARFREACAAGYLGAGARGDRPMAHHRQGAGILPQADEGALMALNVEYAAATSLDDFTSPFADRRYSRFAMIFPPLAAREVLELSRDIALHGLRSPIVLLDDEILDGRARFEACRMVGIDPIFETHDGDDPLAFVVSSNLHRRHLNESQRAIVAARLANWPMGLNQTTARPANLPVWRVAEMFRISPRSVATAKRLLSSRKPTLIEDVSSGVLSLHRASRMARGHEDVDTGSRLPKSRIACAPFASICLRNIPDLIRDAEREIAVLRALEAHAQAEDADAIVSDVISAEALAKLLNAGSTKT